MSSGQMRLHHPVDEMAAIVHVPQGSKTRVRNGSETAPTDCCLQAASPSSASLAAGNPAKPAWAIGVPESRFSRHLIYEFRNMRYSVSFPIKAADARGKRVGHGSGDSAPDEVMAAAHAHMMKIGAIPPDEPGEAEAIENPAIPAEDQQEAQSGRPTGCPSEGRRATPEASGKGTRFFYLNRA
jgi:hypothetical protein